ncbi:MAG: helix-turn-helix domain-containing protein [Actinomycetota bacterium]|nr:helix-turn-helix domain-containing protein [Actinomycetota bacterium]MDQ3954480.1 helix-turn-helix domain-containing protein [Actinomycetota bacterium]
MTELRIVSATELKRFGRALRNRRLAAGMTQAQLEGSKYTHSFISSVESGRRGASKEAVEYFAQRLGIPAEEVWGDIEPHWAMQMATDLRDKGRYHECRALLARTLENLARDREIHSSVLVTLHLEMGWLDLPRDAASAEAHLRRCLELAGQDDLLMGEIAEANAGLGRLLEERDPEEALERYKNATIVPMELLGRSPRLTRLQRLRRRDRPRPGRVG